MLAGYRANLAAAGESDGRLQKRLSENVSQLTSLSMDAAVSQMPRLQVSFPLPSLAVLSEHLLALLPKAMSLLLPGVGLHGRNPLQLTACQLAVLCPSLLRHPFRMTPLLGSDENS